MLIMRWNTMCRSEEARYDFKNVHLRGPGFGSLFLIYFFMHAEISLRGNFSGRRRERLRVRRICGNHGRVVKSPVDRPKVTKNVERFFFFLPPRGQEEAERRLRSSFTAIQEEAPRDEAGRGSDATERESRASAGCHLLRQPGDD